MELATFHALPDAEVADLVQAHGIDTCGFTFNGTRRWYHLEHESNGTYFVPYIKALMTSVIDIAQIMFDQGLTTLVFPVISPRILDRRSRAYNVAANHSLVDLLQSKLFIDFYTQYEVQPTIYGDYQNYLPPWIAEGITEGSEMLREQLPDTAKRRILWGVCAHEPGDSMIQATLDHYLKHGSAPTQTELRHAYYGVPIEPAQLYVGSGKLKAVDMPMLITSQTALYFSTAPSPYFGIDQMRLVLHDLIFNRPVTNHDANGAALENLRHFYTRHRDSILGVGERDDVAGVWQPRFAAPAGIM